MTPGNVLIVEDEKNLGITLNEYLQGIGHQCTLARTVSEAREMFQTTKPQLVLMDIGLPDGNGLDLAREFRNRRKDFVLLFLSALNDPETKVEGLEIGAQDYITKPFALKELLLRMERIFKEQDALNKEKDEIICGPLKIWFKRFEVADASGEIIPLGQKENAILRLLWDKAGVVVSRDDIIEKIWGDDKFPSNRTVDNYIVKLRRWCETDLDENIRILSVRGIGYKLTKK